MKFTESYSWKNTNNNKNIKTDDRLVGKKKWKRKRIVNSREYDLNIYTLVEIS